MDAIATIESLIKDPRKELPDEVFLFISRITPLINVDLLIENEKNHTLLTWRKDKYHTAGWHIPEVLFDLKKLLLKGSKL